MKTRFRSKLLPARLAIAGRTRRRAKSKSGRWSSSRSHLQCLPFVLRVYLLCPLAFASLVLFLTGAAPLSRDMGPLRGTIQWTENDIYVVKSSNGNQWRLKLAANSAIATRVNTVLWPISDGSYLGIVAIPQADGSLRAV